MAKARIGYRAGRRLPAAVEHAAAAWAAPTVAQMLSFQPQAGRSRLYSTPTPRNRPACKVELVTGARAGQHGWLLRDPHGQPLRRFFDTNGDRKIDVWSYYQDGVEVYREIDTNFNGKTDQYRWLNAGGMKWGIDVDEDGKIETWKMIPPRRSARKSCRPSSPRTSPACRPCGSPTRRSRRWNCPPPRSPAFSDLQKQAPAKFQATVAKLTDLSAKTHWERLEAGAPQCVPADGAGMKQDVIKYPRPPSFTRTTASTIACRPAR